MSDDASEVEGGASAADSAAAGDTVAPKASPNASEPKDNLIGRPLEPATVPRQCTATSKQSGKRCKRSAITGGTVCMMHGGKAPQVQRKARLRLMELVDPAIATLAREMVDQSNKSRDKQAAANSILDRAGITRGSTIEIQDARDMLLERLLQLRGNDEIEEY